MLNTEKHFLFALKPQFHNSELENYYNNVISQKFCGIVLHL